MKTATKIWIWTATTLVLIGLIIFVGVMTMLKWDFGKLSTAKYEENSYEVLESYQCISILTDTADIVFVPSVSETGSAVTCYEQQNAKHSVTVKDGTLTIELVDTRKWYEFIGINFSTPKITVALPESEYGKLLIKASTGDIKIPNGFGFESMDITLSTGDVASNASALGGVKIKTSTGDIHLENLSAGSLDLSVTTGKVTLSQVNCKGALQLQVSTGKSNLSDIHCKSLASNGNTGDLTLKNVIATEGFSITRSTGDVRFEACDAAEIFVQTDTGSITGSLLSPKVFLAKTDTGRINVPNTVTGGKCEIITDTGNIKITLD